MVLRTRFLLLHSKHKPTQPHNQTTKQPNKQTNKQTKPTNQTNKQTNKTRPNQTKTPPHQKNQHKQTKIKTETKNKTKQKQKGKQKPIQNKRQQMVQGALCAKDTSLSHPQILVTSLGSMAHGFLQILTCCQDLRTNLRASKPNTSRTSGWNKSLASNCAAQEIAGLCVPFWHLFASHCIDTGNWLVL